VASAGFDKNINISDTLNEEISVVKVLVILKMYPLDLLNKAQK
jgi:hypothetical protein